MDLGAHLMRPSGSTHDRIDRGIGRNHHLPGNNAHLDSPFVSRALREGVRYLLGYRSSSAGCCASGDPSVKQFFFNTRLYSPHLIHACQAFDSGKITMTPGKMRLSPSTERPCSFSAIRGAITRTCILNLLNELSGRFEQDR
jgi:hypothetical protein